MNGKALSFHVRTKDDASLQQIVSRVEHALNCTFLPVEGEEFEGTEALEARVLGLRLTLTCWPSIEDANSRVYWLTGVTIEDVLELSGDTIDASEFILNVMAMRDNGKWYIPTLKEKYLESGLEWPEEE